MAFDYTNEDLVKALEVAGGQPTKAAKALGISYVQYWRLTKDIPDFKSIMQAYRAKTFEDLSSLSLVAIKNGTIPRTVKGDEGQKDKTIWDEVDTRTRLDMASKIMNMMKGDVGIVDKSEIDHGATESFLDFLKQTSSL